MNTKTDDSGDETEVRTAPLAEVERDLDADLATAETQLNTTQDKMDGGSKKSLSITHSRRYGM